MLNFFTILTLMLTITHAQEATLDLEAFFKASESKENTDELGISYHHFTPEYEDNQPADKQVVIEMYQGEYKESTESKKQLELIKSILEDDKKLNKGMQLEAFAVGPQEINIKESEKVQTILDYFDTNPVKFETIENPKLSQVQFQSANFKLDRTRQPSSLKKKILNPKTYWTLIRGTSSFGATFAGLYIAEGLTPGVASMVSLMPALASGGMTYFNGPYGNFLTSGKWSKWLLESDSKFAKTMRKGFGLNAKSFEAHYKKNLKSFRNKYPNMFERNKSVFTREARSSAQDAISSRSSKLKNILSKLHNVEEYLKWYVTEVAFVGLAIKAPQAIAGIGATGSILGTTGDILGGSAIGMIAQGPGDIAIQLRKYQKIEELKAKIISGKVENTTKELTFVENKKTITKSVTLLEEIEMVLAKTGEHAKYSIRTESHRALNRIENWARSRATMLSFFSVAGVGMQLAGIPVAQPLLIGVGVGGGVYFSHVKGWLKFSAIKEKIKKIKVPQVNMRLTSVFNRFCQVKFIK